MKKYSKIFIAGHSGLVGSAVYRNLITHGYKNLVTVSSKELDLRSMKDVDLFIKKKKIEYLIMCAARAGGILANINYPADFFNDNILIQNNLLNSAIKYKFKKTIFLGTSCIYPFKAKNPIREKALLTGTLHRSNQAYAIAKIAGIKFCEAIYYQYNLDIVALMPTNIYGLNDRYEKNYSHVIPALLMKFLSAKKHNKKTVEIWGDGSPKREFLYSDDLAEAIRLVLLTPKKKLFNLCDNNFPIINIGSNDIYSIKELAELIKNKLRYNGKIIFNKKYPNGVYKKNISSTRINTLGWRPSINLSKGLDLVLKTLK